MQHMVTSGTEERSLKCRSNITESIHFIYTGGEQLCSLTGAEIVIECLKEQKVDTVFGYPGGAILNIYDALYKHQ